jgi:hypothetical protein
MQRELVILSSSPVPSGASQRRLSTVEVPSSPGLPSTSNILPATLPQGLRRGSHATAIPETATFGFQSALSLLPPDVDTYGPNTIDVQEKTARKSTGKSTIRRARSKQTAIKDSIGDSITASEAKSVGEPIKRKRGRPRKAEVAAPRSGKAGPKKSATKNSVVSDEKENTNVEPSTIDLTGDAPLRPKKSWTPPRTVKSREESFSSLANKLSEFVHIDAEPQVLPTNAETTLLKRKRLEVRIPGLHTVRSNGSIAYRRSKCTPACKGASSGPN